MTTSTQSKPNPLAPYLRFVVAYVRLHETNPVFLAKTEAAVRSLNEAVANHQPITDAMLTAAKAAILDANSPRGHQTPVFKAAVREANKAVTDAPAPVAGTPAPAGTPTTPAATPAPTPEAPAAPATPVKAPRPKFDNVPEGRYAFVADDGHVAFAQVVHHDYPSGTYAFANLLIGSPGDYSTQRLSRDATVTVLTKIAESPQAAAALFGRKTETCGHCGSALSQPQSRAAGYGPTCAENHGYFYPSLAEALEMLDEAKTTPENKKEAS